MHGAGMACQGVAEGAGRQGGGPGGKLLLDLPIAPRWLQKEWCAQEVREKGRAYAAVDRGECQITLVRKDLKHHFDTSWA